VSVEPATNDSIYYTRCAARCAHAIRRAPSISVADVATVQILELWRLR